MSHKEFWCTGCGAELDAKEFRQGNPQNAESVFCPHCDAYAGPDGDVWLYEDALAADPNEFSELTFPQPERPETEEDRLQKLREGVAKAMGW